MAKNPPSEASAAAAKRGRPAAESPHERLARLETELAEAAGNPELKKTLAGIIAKHVKAAAAKAEGAALLPE